MIKLITLPNQRIAQAFVDYMATKRIRIEIAVHQQGVDLLLVDETLVTQVMSELDYFIDHPNDPRYLAASWQTGQVAKQIGFNRFVAIQKTGFLTLTVTIVCVIAYIVMQLFGDYSIMLRLAFPFSSAQYSQLWRWLTPIFLHFSILHIVFNLLWWWYLGGMVERQLGKWKLLELLLLSAIVSNYCQSIYSGPNFGGLSGVIYCLIAYCWLMGERAPTSGIFLQRSLMAVSFIWLVAGFSGYLGPIANIAHLAGLLVGLLLAWKDVYVLKGQKKRPGH